MRVTCTFSGFPFFAKLGVVVDSIFCKSAKDLHPVLLSVTHKGFVTSLSFDKLLVGFTTATSPGRLFNALSTLSVIQHSVQNSPEKQSQTN